MTYIDEIIEKVKSAKMKCGQYPGTATSWEVVLVGEIERLREIVEAAEFQVEVLFASPLVVDVKIQQDATQVLIDRVRKYQAQRAQYNGVTP